MNVKTAPNYVDKIFYSDKENVSDYKAAKFIVKDIQSVSDYLRAITIVLSNYYITKTSLPICYFENLFLLDYNAHKSMFRNGLFFRGQNKEYNEFVFPGLFRNPHWILNESDLVRRYEIVSPDILKKATCEFDKLALMQHYGGKTRILDITTNALVALFFSVFDYSNANENDDGIVYLFKNKENNNDLIQTSNSDIVSIKTALSKLSFEQKKFLSDNLRYIKDSKQDVKNYFKIKGITDDLESISCLYNAFYKDSKTYSREIHIKDLFGINIVKPCQNDNRIIQQNGAFIICGLENISESLLDESISNFKRVIKIQKEIDLDINELEILYSSEKQIDPTLSRGVARIKIKSKYKKQIKDELNIIGINEGSIFPDFEHKICYINQLFD